MTGNAMLGLSKDIKHSSRTGELTNKGENHTQEPGAGAGNMGLVFIPITSRQK